MSDTSSVSAGDPQGSKLGPLLFIIFINDSVEVVPKSKCLLYADGLKIYLEVVSVEDCPHLQADVDRLVSRSEVNVEF